MFNTACIDSLKVRVKMEHVAVIDKRIITDYIMYYPDLETLDDDNQPFVDETLRRAQPFTQIVNGITYRFYPKAFINKNKYAEEYMVFQLSAKMAKHKYFQGITLENIVQIVDDINSFNVIKITVQKMLQGLWSDTDICINQLIDEKSLKVSLSNIMSCALQGKKPLMHLFNSTAKNNVGLDFNKREKASNSAPYCKIYHKGYELQSKSIDFYKAYLEPMQAGIIDNLVRYEYTIKAHKHKEYLRQKGFNVPEKTLKDLLSTPMKDLQAIAMSGIMNYIEPRTKSVVDGEKSVNDIMLSYYIQNLIKLGFDDDQLIAFTYQIDDKFKRSRAKSKAKQLIEEIRSADDKINQKLIQNEKSNQFLKSIGVTLSL